MPGAEPVDESAHQATSRARLRKLALVLRPTKPGGQHAAAVGDSTRPNDARAEWFEAERMVCQTFPDVAF